MELKARLGLMGGGFPGGSVVKNPSANAAGPGWIPGSGRSPGKGNSNPLQCPCLGQRSLEGVSPWGRRESDMPGCVCTLGTYVTI